MERLVIAYKYPLTKDEPVPDGRRVYGAAVPKYPWHGMEIGHSFLTDGRLDSMRATAYAASKRYAPKRWVVRRVEGGVRVWRVK